MQRFIAKRLLSGRNSNSLPSPACCFSQLAQKEDNDVLIPKMPPFDYSPPPYTGPSANEIMAKRKEFLSPSLFHFYKNPVVFFTNSGTEANELAMMIARLYTGSNDIISLRNAYHGNAAGTMGATAQSIWKFNVIQSGVHHALNPDPYRGVFGSDGEKYAKDVQDIIDFGTTGHVAGFISEAIQGVGGIVELAPGYLPAAYTSIKKAGGLCIADEVQAGFARTGSHFWGFEAQGVVPDIVTMAKGIGNGIPLGAVVTTPEIAEILTRRSYFNTFGGNPVCTAAGLAVLNDEKENLQENAHWDVRGRGLMLGVELVTDREQKTPAKAETLHVMEQRKAALVTLGESCGCRFPCGCHGLHNVKDVKPQISLLSSVVHKSIKIKSVSFHVYYE
ncbi:hypothetical protein GH714_018890 [Hevea brasiliensis]|uniref:Uncharacterized protein n=1 Tax=Hevea brasiliensis TaxID=3981 RepID=A0A6A6M2D5_HEVBR|nr:hypothetical protein GH714_018890 [Hevea brasiliensis]